MTTPAIIYLTLTIVSLSVWVALHGKTIKVNSFTRVADACLVLALLYWGGFFNTSA